MIINGLIILVHFYTNIIYFKNISLYTIFSIQRHAATMTGNGPQNNKKSSTTWNNISTNKTKIVSNDSIKKLNIISEEYNLFIKKIKKNKEDNNNKYNKSLEEFIINNDFLLQYKIE